MNEIAGNVLLQRAARKLAAHGVPEPMRDARRLFAFAAGVSPSRVTLLLPELVDPVIAKRFDELIARRAEREPVSHLCGARSFYGRMFEVTRDVLDPRPETETLIAAALKSGGERILDLGTGSGCILVTLLAEMSDATGVGVDLSPAALKVAARNADQNGVGDRASFVCSNWSEGVAGPFDLVVSNPPYIAMSEMVELSPEVSCYEPRMALTDERDGLTHYQIITRSIRAVMARDATLIFEIGPTQGQAVTKLMRQAGFEKIETRPDLDGRDRVVSGKIGS